MKKAKPKKKPRRVVLGVGHPWFYHVGMGFYDKVALTSSQNKWPAKELNLGNLGNWNKIRLVAEVLK